MIRSTHFTPRSLQRYGFSLPELLVVSAILGITAAVGVQSFFFLVRRARINSIALETAGWIENVRNAAADEVSQTDTLGGCILTFDPEASSAGDSLGTVDEECTVPENELFIPPQVQQDTVTISIVGPNPVVFTPRGLWTDEDGIPGAGVTISMTLDADGPERCVRLTPILGAVEIGRPADGSTACADDAEWQTL